MKKIWIVICCVFLAFNAYAEFFGETDIPLMDGLRIDESDTFSFDVPAGQIVGFSATTKKSVREVQEFYQDALTELGWKKKAVSLYQRDQDELTLQITSGRKGTLVKIQYAFPNR